MTLAERISALALAVRDKVNLMVPRLLPAGGTVGQMLRKTGAGNYATGWGDPGFPITIGRTTVNQVVSSTSVVNITNLTAPVVAAGVYRVTGRVVFQTAGLAVGATIGYNGPAGSVGQMVIAIPTTALISTGTATIRTNGSSGSGTTTSVVAAGSAMVASVDGLLTVGATQGTFALQVAASSLAGTVTVMSGSVLVLEKLV